MSYDEPSSKRLLLRRRIAHREREIAELQEQLALARKERDALELIVKQYRAQVKNG